MSCASAKSVARHTEFATENERGRKQAITALESKSTSHAETLAKEAAETEEMHEAIHSLSAQKEEHVARRDSLRAEIDSVQHAIKQRRGAQAAYQRSLDSQAKHNMPELRFWEHCLGLRIEGTGIEDQLRFVYVCVGERDTENECSFDLHMGGKDYAVVETSPKLERGRVEEAQEKLNETRELGGFLKEMRSLLVKALNG